jgi:hypothetical protein
VSWRGVNWPAALLAAYCLFWAVELLLYCRRARKETSGKETAHD